MEGRREVANIPPLIEEKGRSLKRRTKVVSLASLEHKLTRLEINMNGRILSISLLVT